MFVVVSFDTSISSRHAVYGPYETYRAADLLRERLIAKDLESIELMGPKVRLISIVVLESAR